MVLHLRHVRHAPTHPLHLCLIFLVPLLLSLVTLLHVFLVVVENHENLEEGHLTHDIPRRMEVLGEYEAYLHPNVIWYLEYPVQAQTGVITEGRPTQ